MPLRNPLFEFGSRNFVCRSCRSTLQKSTQWPIRYSSQAAFAQGRSKSTTHAPSDEDAERLKALQTLGLLQDESPKLTVNYFEQGRRGRVRRLRDADEFHESLADARDIESGLKELEQQLEQATQLTKALEELGGGERANELRQRFVSEIDALDLPSDADNNHSSPQALSASSLMAHRRDSSVRLRQAETMNVAQFNYRVKLLAKKVDSGKLTGRGITGLWKAYATIRRLVVQLKITLSPALWDFLWQLFSLDRPDNDNRMSHVYYFAKDMQDVGIPLRPDQQVLAIEAIFIEGWKEEALASFKRFMPTLGSNPDVFFDFWQLGLRMYCLMGDVEQAEKMIDAILKSPRKEDPRFIMPYIGLCTKSPETLSKAFGAYRKLRATLGDSMTIEDYDRIIAYFLLTDHADLALCIFVDMMKSGAIDLYKKSDFPTSVANPFFFGKWVKRLIGLGDPGGAYKVFQFMRTKNVVPHAIHVNGLLGAWYRSGIASNIKQGETVAWLMINARLQYVQMRKRSSALTDQVSLRRHGNGWPNATLETFCLVAENYQLRGLHTKMEELWRAFRESELAPDSFMMNQLLLSYLHSGKGAHILPLFRGLTQKYSIVPDAQVFMSLWKSLTVNRLIQVKEDDAKREAEIARGMFSDMMKFAAVFEDGRLDVILARRILHSFRKVHDTIGLLLAYRALRHIFGFSPPEAVAIEILTGSEDLEKVARGRGVNRLIEARARVDNYLKEKHGELVESGELGKDDQLPPEVVRRELNNYVELCLQTQAIREFKGAKDIIEQEIRQAAKEMGLERNVESEEAALPGTEEETRNTEEVAQGTEEVARGIEEVAEGIEEVAQGIGEMAQGT
ncbi:hypothetical protein F5X96DRAFT_639612 [Biscogniauxia mediterranea]|nr:hypothetical protein F5X96DRAFT_639612 [Biscogniauxia mediterranea]